MVELTFQNHLIHTFCESSHAGRFTADELKVKVAEIGAQISAAYEGRSPRPSGGGGETLQKRGYPRFANSHFSLRAALP